MTDPATNTIITPLPWLTMDNDENDSFSIALEEVNRATMKDRLAPGLHIVATPIGNLGDLAPRAADTLRRADRILAEDTRVTAKLLAHIGAKAPMSRYDDHTSSEERERIVGRLGDEAVAL